MKKEIFTIKKERGEATFSKDKKYRYVLTRTWDKKRKRILFIGLNPTSLSSKASNPTVRRIVNFAKKWGYGSVSLCNLFGYRTTKPEILKKEKKPIGKNNDTILKQEIKKADLTVAAWGNHGTHLNRSIEIKKYLTNHAHLGLTKKGEPKHPLYLKNDQELHLT